MVRKLRRPAPKTWQRRSVAALAVGATLAGGLLGSATALAAETNGAWIFSSAPTLYPAGIEVGVNDPPVSPTGSGSTGAPTASPGDIFVAPIKNYNIPAAFIGSPGPEILEPNGTLVWEDRLGGPVKLGNTYTQVVAMDFHPETYAGQPVIVWWQGYITPQGFGNGVWEIANQHYQTIATLQAPPGYDLDFHEIQITPQGNAYILASRPIKLSLTCCGGSSNGELNDESLFEVEVKSGRVLWSWDPLQHVRLRESYAGIPSSGPWDPYHLNSVSFGPAGNPIVSARNTWAAYWVERGTGKVIATLGGKHSSFKLGPGVGFAWQHDVLQQVNQQVSVFDDEAAPTVGKQSRALMVALNWQHMTATLVREYLLPHVALAGSQGNVQVLSNGNLFVGWGQLPYFSEYSSGGKLVYLGRLPGPDESYRSFRSPWIGLPMGYPGVSVEKALGGVNVYASWNGATQIVSWQLLSGASASALAPYGSPVARQGFETQLPTLAPGPYYAVRALSASGHTLGTSAAATLPPPKTKK